jgi:uncharacterized protein YmfQ (DUF2313 family)
MDLMQLLPEVYEGNSSMEKLQEILTTDIINLADSYNETINECFVNTASKLLSRYEKIYGIEVDVSKADTFRRERIKAKIRGVGTVTKQMLINTAKSYSNGDVEVIEEPENNSFRVKFIGSIGIPQNMDGLTMTIEEIKPAHLSYTFEYVFNRISTLSRFTNAHLSNYSNYQLRNEVLS